MTKPTEKDIEEAESIAKHCGNQEENGSELANEIAQALATARAEGRNACDECSAECQSYHHDLTASRIDLEGK